MFVNRAIFVEIYAFMISYGENLKLLDSVTSRLVPNKMITVPMRVGTDPNFVHGFNVNYHLGVLP